MTARNPTKTRPAPDVEMAQDSVEEAAGIINLVPMLDPATGQTVYADPDCVWTIDDAAQRRLPDTAATSHEAGSSLENLDIQIDRGGISTIRTQGRTPITSVLPTDVMAADGWDAIRQALGDAERGRTSSDVVLQPGGELTLAPTKPGTPRPVSSLPRDVMASGPSLTDLDELRRLDPLNVENWTPLKVGMIPGWTFVLASGHPRVSPFHFLTFRSAVDGGGWRTAVLKPNMDSLYGHSWHMTRVSVAGKQLPVICGPGGAAARTLADVRVDAAKWKTYVAARIVGLDPGFSR